MLRSTTLSFCLVLAALAGCKDDPIASNVDMGTDAGAPIDSGAQVIGPDGATGICCPVDYSCDCSYKGGWATSLEECPRVCDQGGNDTRTDSFGCEVVIGDSGCFLPADSGVPGDAGDAGAPDDAGDVDAEVADAS
ncbi:MAG: hypothetical protein IPK60_14075 [Sandaracinaceae bacterium]|jgi:hypothetical protein|nr:hypothetical protein [Sandaracinaceae bacterium]